MRRRKCKVCGSEFQGKGEQRLCPDCRKKSKQASVVRPRQCIVCGCVFDGGPSAKYCPSCRAERKRKTDAESQRRKAAGNARKIGSTDICEVCGKEYVVCGGLQKYCPDCAAEAVRQKVLPRKRERAAEHIGENTARKREMRMYSAICAYCGRVYTSTGPSVTCSAECAREYKRIVMGTADYKRGRRKSPPSHERYSSGLPQSEIPGVTYHRCSGKWQVTHKGKYIGLFGDRLTAEAKKAELEGSSEETDR